MKVTLRQAHKLVDKINAKAATVAVTTTAAASLWADAPADVLFQAASMEFRKQLNRKLDLAGARQEIRSAIQAVNGTEVNGLVSARKSLLDQLAVYREVVATITDSVNTPGALAAKLAAEKAGPRNVYAGDTVAFCVTDPIAKAAFEKQVADLQLRVEAIEDQLTTSNAASSIVLSEQVVTILRREGLVQ